VGATAVRIQTTPPGRLLSASRDTFIRAKKEIRKIMHTNLCERERREGGALSLLIITIDSGTVNIPCGKKLGFASSRRNMNE
jgi:hypothetical protein